MCSFFQDLIHIKSEILKKIMKNHRWGLEKVLTSKGLFSEAFLIEKNFKLPTAVHLSISLQVRNIIRRLFF